MYDTETIIVRLFNTYGPGEFYHPYRSVNCKFCYHALHNLPIVVFKGHNRSSTYIDDSVRTVANISDKFIPGRIYNIGSDQSHDIETLANTIWNYTGAPKTLITYKESEMLTTKIKRVDINLSIKELDHKATVSLEDGVKRTIDWMKDYYRLN
jgi:dTDP-glucose 4,6-dehydratase